MHLHILLVDNPENFQAVENFWDLQFHIRIDKQTEMKKCVFDANRRNACLTKIDNAAICIEKFEPFPNKVYMQYWKNLFTKKLL